MSEQSWTDDPITASPLIRKKAIHFTELQDAINSWENAYSISASSFTDSPAPKVKIKSTVISEMQDALDNLLSLATSAASGSFNWDVQTKINPKSVNDVRTNMNIMQNDYCYQCDSCDTYSGCSCDNSCDSDACDLCDTSCNGYSGCACNSTCYNNVCPTCNNACYGSYSKTYCSICDYTCYSFSCGCNSTCYGYSACSCNSSCYNDVCDQCDASCYEYSCSACYATNYRYPWS